MKTSVMHTTSVLAKANQTQPLKKNSISIIVFFFGQRPWYDKLFLASCLRNESVNFLYFSDSFTEDRTLRNICEIKFSMDDFNRLASRKLGFNIEVKSGLKLCDLRPAFGVIFEDYLKDFNFWGYADTDIIFGDIRSFFTDADLSASDFFSIIESYPSGFFALFRNSPITNELFLKCEHFAELINYEENMLFEECGGYYSEVIAGKSILETDCPYDTLHHLLMINSESIRSSFRQLSVEDSLGNTTLQGKNLRWLNRDVLMFHLTKIKNNFFLQIPPASVSNDDLQIFKFSFRRRNLLSMLRGSLYDFTCAFAMLVSVRIDKGLKRTERYIGFNGIFCHMNSLFSVETIDGHSYVCVGNCRFRLFRSMLFRKKYLIEELESYVDICDSGRYINLIYHDGTVRSFRKELADWENKPPSK